MFTFSTAIAMTGATGAVAGAFCAFGAADTLNALFRGSVNVPYRKSDDCCDDRDDKNICKVHRASLSAQCVFGSQILAVIPNHACNYSADHHHNCQAGDGSNDV